MDRLESLGSQLSQITMYDIKSMYNQARNMVLNVTEMEAKVREATNDEPWGASSTLMQEIAQGTFNFQHFNEIMPCIYSRFMDKEARQWREIYKALQLLEYIIKHGSERVVDDARSHLSTIKMLRNFHYIDDKGKDQGINVRNRAKEVSEMLMDVERIRTERRKAKANRNKYIGTGNDSMSFSGGGGRYGGFGSDSPSGGSYGGGGSGSGGFDREYGGNSSSGGFRDETSRRGYDEYDAGDYEAPARRSNSLPTGGPGRSAQGTGAGSSARLAATTPAPPKVAPKPKEVDLLGFGDDDPFGAPVSATDKALPAVAANNPLDGDDDFDDFQAAPPSADRPTVFEFLNSTPAQPASVPPVTQTQYRPPTVAQQQAPAFAAGGFPALAPTNSRQAFASPVQSPTMFAAQQPPIYAAQQPLRATSPPMRPTHASKPSFGAAAVKPAAPASVGFDDLWNLSLGSGVGANKPAAGGSKSIKDLEKEKAQAGIWGNSAPAQNRATGSGSGMGMGSFGASSGASAMSGGGDDLLL